MNCRCWFQATADGRRVSDAMAVHRSLFAVCSFFARSLHDSIAPILPARNASRSDAGGHHTAHQHLDGRNPGMTLSELQEIYTQPFFDLISQARSAYLEYWPRDEVQLCTLLSINTVVYSTDSASLAQ